jgi:hypothetical protein
VDQIDSSHYEFFSVPSYVFESKGLGDPRWRMVRASGARDNRNVARLAFIVPLFLIAARPGLSFAKLTSDATAAFDAYVGQAEAGMGAASVRDPRLRGEELEIEASRASHDAKAPGGMIQDWVGRMFIPGVTIAQVRAMMQDYPNYKNFFQPEVVESKQLARAGEEFDVFLRLYEKHVLTVVLNTTYHIRYSVPDAQQLTVTSRSTRIAEVSHPDNSYEAEEPVGDDGGFLWRLNSYWRFAAADGGVYARCEAISLSRDVLLGLGWMLKGFLERFPKESMRNTLRGTKAAVESRNISPGSSGN